MYKEEEGVVIGEHAYFVDKRGSLESMHMSWRIWGQSRAYIMLKRTGRSEGEHAYVVEKRDWVGGDHACEMKKMGWSFESMHMSWRRGGIRGNTYMRRAEEAGVSGKHTCVIENIKGVSGRAYNHGSC